MSKKTPCRLTIGSNTYFRAIDSFEHADLCRAFNLDQASFSFDLPRTAYRRDVSHERVSGYVLKNGRHVGTLHVAIEGEKFRDIDPVADRMTLRQTDRN